MRGGERVLEVLCETFPDASLHTLLHVPGSVSPVIERHAPQTSFLQRVPGIARLYRHLLPLYPLAIDGLDVGDADVVISTSHCAAKSVPTRPGARHLCYCFTAGALCLGPVRRLFRPGTGRAGALGGDAAAAGPVRPLGPAHEHPSGPLCGDLSICCAENQPIL